MNAASAVRLDVDGGVATIWLSGRDAVNGVDPDLFRALRAALVSAEARADVHVLVLRGEGGTFCGGASIEYLQSFGDGAHDAVLLSDLADNANRAAQMPHESRLLTIAAVEGAVAGGGMGLMLAADMAIAPEGTLFCVAYAALGVTPGVGVFYHLVRAAGYRRALALFLSSERFDVARALELNLINEAVPPEDFDQHVTTVARRLAAGPNVALAKGKRLMRRAVDTSLAQQLDDEIRTIADCFSRPAFAEGVAAFLEKRPPDFQRATPPAKQGQPNNLRSSQ